MRLYLRDLENFIYDMGINVAALTKEEKQKILKPLKDRVIKHIRTNASKMLRGTYFVEEVKKSVYLSSRHINDENPYYEINFRGWLHKIRNGKKLGGKERAAAVAFLNEYGVPIKKAQRTPRPFIKEALYDGEREAEQEIARMFGDIVENKIKK